MDHPLPWLRYLDADELDDDGIDFDGMNVEGVSGEKLGDVDGFIVDSSSARPYYVVVDNDGWLTTKHFLVPVGHIRLDESRNVLVADLTRERIKKFPGFDKDAFQKMSVDDIRTFNNNMCDACSGTVGNYSTSEPLSAAWDRPQYAYPTWWRSNPHRPDRMGASAVTKGVEDARIVPPAGSGSIQGDTYREQVVARESATSGAEPSPHFEGRAQPGDVIGFETGGERTHVGETADDENKRRIAAEKATRKD